MAVERVEGVREAKFSYDRGEGFVTFDRTVTSPEAFIAELERLTAFTAEVRETDSESTAAEHEDAESHEDGAGNQP